MTKSEKLHIVLKDIKELEVLVRGMVEMTEVPAIVRNLSLTQARNIFDGLSQLTDAGAPLLESQLSHVEDLADRGVAPAMPQPEKVEPAPQPAPQPQPTPEPILVQPISEAPAPSTPQEDACEEKKPQEMVVEQNAQVVDIDIKTQPAPVAEEKKSEPKAEKGTDIATNKVKEAQERGVAGERFRTSVRSLNETLSRKPETRFVASLRKAININDRIRYQRELFANDPSAMNDAIERLDAMATLSEAMAYVSTLGWGGGSEAEADFLALLEARFAHAN